MTAMSQPFMSTAEDGFFVAAFSAFGHFEGVGLWEYRKLSERWIAVWRELLDELGDVFDYRWSSNLSHIRTKLTSSQGAGICTIFVNDQTASSILLMSGKNQNTEREVMEVYLRSLDTPLLTSPLGRAGEGFSELRSISERPLMAVVPFPSQEISDGNHELVRELGWHLAAAFMQD